MQSRSRTLGSGAQAVPGAGPPKTSEASSGSSSSARLAPSLRARRFFAGLPAPGRPLAPPGPPASPGAAEFEVAADAVC